MPVLADVVLAHHERFDGRGYPAGLAGEEIPAIARIIQVAELFDTVTSGRSYRWTMTADEGFQELRRVAGTQIDPGYVQAVIAVVSGGAEPTASLSVRRNTDGFARAVEMAREADALLGP